MNAPTGYATMTAAEHEQEAEQWAHLADKFRNSFHHLSTDIRRMQIRKYQNLAAMHQEDADRMHNAQQ
jgi:hypothetical protein